MKRGYTPLRPNRLRDDRPYQVNESEFWRSVIIPTVRNLPEYTVSTVVIPAAILFLLSFIR